VEIDNIKQTISTMRSTKQQQEQESAARKKELTEKHDLCQAE
jgi:hypothetical protein